MAFTIHPKFDLAPREINEPVGASEPLPEPKLSDAKSLETRNAYILDQLDRIGIDPSQKCHTCVKLHQCSIEAVRHILAGKLAKIAAKKG